MIQGKRIETFSDKLSKIKEILSQNDDLEQIAILHELIDDTPYKTQNYMKYLHDEFYIVHNKPHLIELCKKVYPLLPKESGETNDLFELIKSRSSVRDYQNKSISFKDFSSIIHYSFGVKAEVRGIYSQRNYPLKYINSQGGLNYLDLYVFVNNVDDIEKGLYYFDFINNQLCQMDS